MGHYWTCDDCLCIFDSVTRWTVHIDRLGVGCGCKQQGKCSDCGCLADVDVYCYGGKDYEPCPHGYAYPYSRHMMHPQTEDYV